MSRGQQGQVFSTAGGQQTTYNNMADTSFGKAEGDISDYSSAVNAFKAANPYVQGGQAETAENQQLSDTAAAGGEAAGQAVQSAAVRTGQNPGGAIAATEKIAEQNQRTLGSQEAGATEQRLGAETGYNEAGLAGQSQVEGMQNTVANEENQAAQGRLGTEETAAQTPSFMDELGQGIIQSGTGFATGFGSKVCWVASLVFGGWYEPRTVLVREWLFGPFSETWYGKRIAQLYLRHGLRLAWLMQKNRTVRWLLTKLCYAALHRAMSINNEATKKVDKVVTHA